MPEGSVPLSTSPLGNRTEKLTSPIVKNKRTGQLTNTISHELLKRYLQGCEVNHAQQHTH